MDRPREILSFTVKRSSWAVIACAALLAIAGCSKVKITGFVTQGLTTADFLRTQITNNGPIVADGKTPLTVTVLLENSNYSVVAGYTPTYVISSGSGVITAPCSASLANGISYCVLRSTVSGSKTFELTNAKVGLASNVDFSAATMTPNTVGILAGSVVGGQTAGNYTVDISAGSTLLKAQGTTTGGYTINYNVQGINQQ